jgi:hypothetical protein
MLFLLSLCISHCRKVSPQATVFLLQLKRQELSPCPGFINVGSLLTKMSLPSEPQALSCSMLLLQKNLLWTFFLHFLLPTANFATESLVYVIYHVIMVLYICILSHIVITLSLSFSVFVRPVNV